MKDLRFQSGQIRTLAFPLSKQEKNNTKKIVNLDMIRIGCWLDGTYEISIQRIQHKNSKGLWTEGLFVSLRVNIDSKLDC